MKIRKKNKKTTTQDQERIDRLVTSQADDETAWYGTIPIKRSKQASLSLPGELAARAAFLAMLHRATAVDKWVERIVRERVELEERAFGGGKEKAGFLRMFPTPTCANLYRCCQWSRMSRI